MFLFREANSEFLGKQSLDFNDETRRSRGIEVSVHDDPLQTSNTPMSPHPI